jgi:hypothetical protein
MTGKPFYDDPRAFTAEMREVSFSQIRRGRVGGNIALGMVLVNLASLLDMLVEEGHALGLLPDSLRTLLDDLAIEQP